MSGKREWSEGMRRRLRSITVMELLTIISIATVFFAIVLPPVQWASDGDIVAPVRVLAFDVELAKPIVGANVVLFRAMPWVDDSFLQSFEERHQFNPFDQSNELNLTNETGEALINFKFHTEASHRNPTPHALTAGV